MHWVTGDTRSSMFRWKKWAQQNAEACGQASFSSPGNGDIDSSTSKSRCLAIRKEDEVSQWRGMQPRSSDEKTENRGTVPRVENGRTEDALSVADLLARGWSRSMIEYFLGEEDFRNAVSHWANFKGR